MKAGRAVRKAGVWLTVSASLAYLVLLLGLMAWVRFGDPDWWLSGVLLYVPRHVALVPIPILAAALFIAKQRRLLWTQVASLVLVLFPIMGLVLPGPAPSDASAFSFRILSFNVDSGFAGSERIAKAILNANPDIAFIQEAKGATEALKKALEAKYPYIEDRPYSLVCSRFPIIETSQHAKIPIRDWPRSPRFQRHVVRLPLGPVAIYNVHPISPRGALNLHRFRGAFHAIRTGQAVNDESIEKLEYNLELRRLQIESVARLALSESKPVILSGDFNLPELSRVLHANLGEFQDGFKAAGGGFGYTFPTKLPWMRLDRVLASHDFHFVNFEMDCEGLSDHYCVVAELEARAKGD